jgi:hypothetical protein
MSAPTNYAYLAAIDVERRVRLAPGQHPPDTCREDMAAKRMGHMFGPELTCDSCGREWWEHRAMPTQCLSPQRADSKARAEQARRRIGTHCKKGHELAEVGYRVDGNGSRRCKECQREHVRKWRLEKE